LILGNNAVAATSTSPGGSELSSFITACEAPEVHSNRAGHGVCWRRRSRARILRRCHRLAEQTP
jgi:hypothetical protein